MKSEEEYRWMQWNRLLKNLDWSPLFYIIKNRNRGDFYIILFRNLCGEKSGKDNTGTRRRSLVEY